MSEMLEHALDYGRRGWPVFPCSPVDKTPMVKSWPAGASRDPDQIRAWWTRHPGAMIGVPMGQATGVFAIDPDAPDGPDGPDGLAAWRDLVAEHGCAHTHTHVTPSGGMHVLFAWQAHRPVTNREGGLKGSGINVRGQGGYIIVPPSVRQDGREYQVAEPLDWFSFAEPPGWLLDLIAPAKDECVVTTTPIQRGKFRSSGHDRRERYGSAALQGECERVASAPRGGRNNQLNTSSFRIGQLVGSGTVEATTGRDALLAAATSAGLVKEDGQRAVLATIESGMTSGATRPRDIPEASRGRAPRQQAEADLAEAVEIDKGPITQDGLARVFAHRHADGLRYCHHSGAWFEWVGSHWRRDETDLAFEYVRQIGREFTEAGTPSELKEVRKITFARGVETFCRSDRTFAVTSALWDQDPFLLGTPDGTVDLRTGVMRRADPRDGITKATAVAPAETAHCPLWQAFMDQTFGTADLVRFMQQWAGYSLTGDIREHALVFGSGSGGNGKSVFVNTVARIMKDYATTAAMDTFTAAHGERHPTDLAMLRGARMVTASETEEGRRWAEARIKQMTGGDMITARFMRQDFFTFAPKFKLLIIGNYRPVLRNVDDALRRRFNIVPFDRKPEKPDRELEAKLQAEWPGILRWMLNGCLDWQVNGLQRPKAVVDATASYFSDQDLLGQWLEEECDAEPGNAYKTETAADLYTSWRQHAEHAGENPGSQKAFADALLKRGFERARTPSARIFRGIRLKPRPAYQQAA